MYTNSLTKNIFETLGACYKERIPPVGSYFHQLNLVSQMIAYDPTLDYFKVSILIIDDQFKCHDEDLLSTINSIINNFNFTNCQEFS